MCIVNWVDDVWIPLAAAGLIIVLLVVLPLLFADGWLIHWVVP